MKRFNKNQNNKGIVILFAVVIAAIVLAITLGITSIAFKSIQLSTSARDSHFAYFAADAAAECGLYYDLKNPDVSARLAAAKQGDGGGDVVINCGGATSPDITATPTDEVSPVVFFNFQSGGMPGFDVVNHDLVSGIDYSYCAVLHITKHVPVPPDLHETQIDAYGYNVSCAVLDANKNVINHNIVERYLRVSYTE